jgi:NuA3 HAT complex component NTO1
MTKHEHLWIEANDVGDPKCDVCLGPGFEDDEAIILCDGCNVAVHQTCYGLDLEKGIPKGDWYC